jgi:hypothetical protein
MNKIFNLLIPRGAWEKQHASKDTLTSKFRDIKPISLKTKKSDSGKEIYLPSFSKE